MGSRDRMGSPVLGAAPPVGSMLVDTSSEVSAVMAGGQVWLRAG